MARRAASPALARELNRPGAIEKNLVLQNLLDDDGHFVRGPHFDQGAAPVLRATIRFWMSVESLKRPPTLLTIFSSFKSSSIGFPFEKGTQNSSHGRESRFQIVVDHLIIVLRGSG